MTSSEWLLTQEEEIRTHRGMTTGEARRRPLPSSTSVWGLGLQNQEKVVLSAPPSLSCLIVDVPADECKNMILNKSSET